MVYEAELLCTLPTGTLPNGAALNENSGFVDSRKHASVFWTHEDSDTATTNAWFYAISYAGALRKIIRLTGISNIAGGPPLYGEWEDPAYHAASGTMWVANCGNNAHTQDTFWAYSFTEPDDISGPGSVLDVPITGQYRFRFADAPAGGWDCETMMVSPSGQLYFANKEATENTGLYQAPATLSTVSVNVLTKVASWPLQANLTGGDWASDNSAIYVHAGNLRGFRYSTSAPYALLEEFKLPAIAGGNPESLAVTRNSRFLLRGAEGAGSQVWRIALPVTPPTQPTKVEWWISPTERLDFTPIAPPPPLVVPGGSFETDGDVSSWTKTGGPANILTRGTSPLTPVDGSSYARLDIESVGTVQNLDSPVIDITAFDVIPELYAWAMFETGPAHNVRLDYRFFTDVEGTTSLSTNVGSGVATNTTDWTEFMHPSIPKPAGAVSMKVRLTALGSPAAPSVVCYDAVGQKVTVPGGEETIAQERARIREEIGTPVNAADAAYQAGDLSSFTTVTTFTDLRAALQAGQRVRVDTTILCPSQILVTTGAALYVGPNGRVLRDYASSGATTQALIRTADLTGGSGYYNNIVPSHNLFFGGPGEIGSSSIANSGNIFSIAGDNMVFDGFTTQQWNGGRHTCWVGDRGRVRRVRFLSGDGAGSGNGGLRYMGGDDFQCMDSRCDSGDDVWQCVPAGALADPFFSISITNARYFNCIGSSATGRVCIIGNQDQNDNGVSTMDCDIIGVQFIDIGHYATLPDAYGVAGGTAIAIQNKSSSGTIADITYKRVRTEGSLAPSGQPGAIYFNVVSAAQGPISNINLIDVEVIDHHRPGVRYGPEDGGYTQKVNGVHFVRGRLERGTEQLSEQIVQIKGENFTMDDTVLFRRGSTSAIIQDLATDAPSDLSYLELG